MKPLRHNEISLKPRWVILLPVAGVGIALVIVRYFQRELMQVQMLAHDWALSLQTFMVSHWWAFGLGQILVAASGVLPASMIAMMAGVTLGFGWGVALSSVSTLLGGWIAFTLSRSALRGWIVRYLHRYPSVARFDEAMTSEGWRTVALLRISPVMPFALTSYGIGLTRISHRDFLLGTLASLPALIGYVAIGALGRQGLLLTSGSASIGHIFALAAGIAIAFYALYRVKKAFSRINVA
ncbi:MAG: DedA [Sphingomonas bacterium]|nr:DedA [Sphingomonas bacterium]